MIHCNPKGLFSWDFSLTGDNYSASLDFNWFGESGDITVNGRSYSVTKDGMISPEWRLHQDGQVKAIATKQSAFTRAFEITHDGQKLSLVAGSAFSRKMKLSGDEYNASITPAHFLTRKSNITGEWDDEVLIAFAFWLSALTWRRQSQSASAG